MKNKRDFLFLLFCVFYSLAGNCQTGWFDQQSVWYYCTPYQYLESDHFTKVDIIGDTLIKGITCKVLSFKDGSNNKVVSTEYVHYRNDSVLYFNYYHDAYYLLYDFTAKEGDTVMVHKNRFKPTNGFQFPDSIDNFKYIVSKIDSIQVSGIWLKRQKVHPLNNGDWTFGFAYDTVAYNIEKIGSLGCFFGRYGVVTTMESIGMLRCYSDNTIYYKNPNWDKECDFVNSIEGHRVSSIYIYANPSNTELNFESTDNKDINFIEIINFDGRTIKRIDVNDVKVTLDISNLISGLYFAKILFSDNSTLTYKFLKAREYEY